MKNHFEKIICKCGAVDMYHTIMDNKQLKAICDVCNSWIKNISYAEPQFYVGKYKGVLIKDCTDKNYMIWFAEKAAKGKIKEAIIKRISEL